MAKKKPTPDNLRQGQTIYYLAWQGMYMRDEYIVKKLFICSEKVIIPAGQMSFQHPRSRIIPYMKPGYALETQFFPTYRSAVRWATDHKLTIVE